MQSIDPACLARPAGSPDPARFIATVRHATLIELVEALMQGTRLLALTAPAGAGKTTLATAVRQELLNRSVRVFCVDRGSTGVIDLRSLTCQLLDKDAAEFSADDIEAVFDLMTTHEVADQKRVLIIDDAENLGVDVLGYLRLLSSIAAEQMPGIVLFARPSLWDDAEQPNRADLRELITDHRELPPLDPDEAKAFALLCVPESSCDEGALDALVRYGGGLIGRLAALLTLAAAIQDEQRLPQLTVAAMRAAAERLDRGQLVAPVVPLGKVGGANGKSLAHTIATQPVALGEAAATSGPRHHAALLSALVSLPILMGAAGATAYWWSALQPRPHAPAEPAPGAGAPPPALEPAVRPLAEAPIAEEEEASASLPATPAEPRAATPDPPDQTWMLADLLDNSVAAAAATDTASEERETADHATPVARATAPEVEHPEEAIETGPPPTATAPVTAAAPLPEQSAETTDQPAVSAAPVTAAADPSVAEHVGDVREAPAVPLLVPADVTPLLQRADAMLALGDIVAARLLYERAATLGSAQAATAIGKTYDPGFLTTMGAAGTAANPDLAANWYRKAARLGDPEATRRLATMTAGG